MRYFIFMLWICLPCTAGAAISAPISQGEFVVHQQTNHHGFAQKKHQFFGHLLAKKLTKRFIKAVGASKGDGRGFAIAGLIAFILNVACWVLSPFLGLIVGLPLAVFGLLLSIISLTKAKPWDSGLSRRVAIWGIVLNGVTLVIGIAIRISLTARF